MLDIPIPFGILPFGIAVDTPNLILSHALELFSARGYDAVGVQEIVLAVGVTKPTLYHHFGNKEGVLEALVTRDSRPLLTKLAAATQYQRRYQGNLTPDLLKVVEVYLNFATTQTSFYRLLSACSLAPRESHSYRAAQPVERAQHQLVATLFERAAQDHGNMQGRAHRYAYSFIGLINTYLRLILFGEVMLSDTLKHDIVKQFSHGIYS